MEQQVTLKDNNKVLAHYNHPFGKPSGELLVYDNDLYQWLFRKRNHQPIALYNEQAPDALCTVFCLQYNAEALLRDFRRFSIERSGRGMLVSVEGECQ